MSLWTGVGVVDDGFWALLILMENIVNVRLIIPNQNSHQSMTDCLFSGRCIIPFF